ncbi:2Fe-2S iron-sulfur cluster-binding protein [Nocardioides limicola]|uniref:2Fe-2S iron-sulfur cluster-binding protein n=1 Tax=Nocardioides limicola TaxID=2803368 RepID=UPI00193C250E|nr:2Fe-2S iron-sulfur cluster-binding protein [Nocardioides sp. DJM-14]
MPKVIYTSPDGRAHTVDARIGASVMETAVKHGIPGIVAECGGALSCATCHVFVATSWIDQTGTAEDFEDEMLDDATTPRQSHSRLSCQIRLTDEFDGLEVTIAPEQ